MNASIVRLICVLAAVLSTNTLAQADSAFTKANQEYAAGHYKEAIDSYEQVVREREFSANLFYDLGNAYFHTGDFGRSILNYDRALQLERHHPETRANLRIARDEARALEISPSKAEHWIEFGDSNQFAFTAAVAFWVGLLCLTFWLAARRRSAGLLATSVVSMIVCVLAITAVFILKNGSAGNGLAVVTGSNVTARLATADNAQTVLALPAGSEIKILSQRGDWAYAALPNDLRGWIPAKDAESVKL